MKTIYKYLMPFAEKVTLALPKGAEVVRIDVLDGHLWMWAVVDTEAETEQREFLLFKTGSKMPEDKFLNYLGCGAIYIQMELMLYVFEEWK